MLGWSGSGGGITYPINKIADFWNFARNLGTELDLKYVDYFINNVCNLRCKHCYVAYENKNDDLTIDDWQRTFDSCLDLGARVFGNVGKEPLLTWDKTRLILSYFNKKREKDNKIKFGIVTNGLLIDDIKAEELRRLNPDYIDLSIDGTENTHDKIRGKGTYTKTLQNILRITKAGLQDKLFISYTLNKTNLHSFPSLIHTLYQLGITNYLISPYLTNQLNDRLELTTPEYVSFIKDLMSNESIDWRDYRSVNLYIRNDFTSNKYQNELLEQKIIDIEKLFKDKNDGVYYICQVGANRVIFNVQTWNPDFWYALRISHDGYVSNCFDMSFPEYPERAIGNVRKNSIREIIQNNRKKLPESRSNPTYERNAVMINV